MINGEVIMTTTATDPKQLTCGNVSSQHRRYAENGVYKQYQDQRLLALTNFIDTWNAKNGNPIQTRQFSTLNAGFKAQIVFSKEDKRPLFMIEVKRHFPESQSRTIAQSVYSTDPNLSVTLILPFQDPETSMFSLIIILLLLATLFIICINLLGLVSPQSYGWLSRKFDVVPDFIFK
jgi:hypothetical protein